MECIANHQSVQMKNRLMARDMYPLYLDYSKRGAYQRALSGFCIKKEGHPSDNLLICGGETGI